MWLRRPTLVHLALLLVCVSAAHRAAAQQGTAGRRGSDELEARTRRFAHVALNGTTDSLLAFFPKTGDFTYVHMVHLRTGDRVQAWRFPAAEARRALQGPLGNSFYIQVEGQPIGLFAHQVLMRDSGPSVSGRLRWRRVRGNRMVPADETAASGFFVEWRREDGEWVVSAFGDESFDGKLPHWCC